MQRSLWFLSLSLLASPGAFSRAQEAAVRYQLTPQDVAGSMQSLGMSVDAAVVQLPASITSSAVKPLLEITDMKPVDAAHLQLRLMCKAQGQCLPFFAYVDLGSAPRAIEAQRLFLLRGPGDVSKSRMGISAVRAGQRATLFIDDERMHISIPVISIDSGAVGSEVRAASLDRKQTFRGTITDNGIIRVVLP